MPARLLTESVGSVAPTPPLANTNRSNRPHIRWGLISAKRGGVGHGPSDTWRTAPSSTYTSNDSEKSNLALGGQYPTVHLAMYWSIARWCFIVCAAVASFSKYLRTRYRGRCQERGPFAGVIHTRSTRGLGCCRAE